MAKRYNTGNPRPSNSMKDLNDNALAYDDFLNSDEEEAVDRFHRSFPTVRKQVAVRINEIIGAQQDAEVYAKEARQAADNAKNIADANTYYTSEADPDGTIAGMAGTPSGKSFRVGLGEGQGFKTYVNNSGIALLIAETPGADDVRDSLHAPNLIPNSYASDSDKLPDILSGTGNAGIWGTPSAPMAALGAAHSVLCPARALPSDPTVNYLFTQDISFVPSGGYVAVSMLYRGNIELVFTRVVPDTAGGTRYLRTEDLGNGIYRLTITFTVLGVGLGNASAVYFGCQQRGSSTAECELAIPKMAVSERIITGVGGDVSFADHQNFLGVVAPNVLYNGYADPRYQLPRLRAGVAPFVLVSSITDATVAAVLADKGAIQCLSAPPVSSGFVDYLVEPILDATVFKGQYAAAQFYVYVKPGAGATAQEEISNAAVFFITEDGSYTTVRPEVIQRLSDNLFKVKALYRYTDGTPRRISMGVRQQSKVTTFYIFGFSLGVAGQRIREILEGPARDPAINDRIDGNAPNIAFNPSGDPAQQRLAVFTGSGVWTNLADLPADVQQISQHGALAAIPALRVASGYKDGIAQLTLSGVKAGDYVRAEFYVYVKADAGVNIPAVLPTVAKGFFWWSSSALQQVAASIKEKITDNIYVMTVQYQYLNDATRVLLGVRNTLSNADFYVFNTCVATSNKSILNVSKGLVRDPQLPGYIDSKLVGVGVYPPVLAVDQPIAKAENFILLPDRLFIPPQSPLLLQCPQMLMNWTADMGQFLDFSFRGESVAGRPYSYETNRTFEIDPDKLGASLSVGFHDRQKPGQWSRRDVTLVRGPATGTASKRISLIGDSLTNRGQSARVSALLRAAGLTITEIGTMDQQESGTGEGREAWAAAHFVGRRGVLGANRVVISYDKPSLVTKNPFLFEATTAQKTANPSMCFLNTGAATEQSYADTQTGTFYTFDYRRYLDQQGFADPDVVSIALAWNDGTYAQTPTEYIAQIQYMVSQIKLACPGCIVAIAPYGHSYLNRARWNSTTSQYVRNVIGAYRGRQTEGLHVLPTWAVMPADTEFSADSSADRVVDVATGSYTDTRYDGIHWDLHGRQYSAYMCLFPFYMWACAQ